MLAREMGEFADLVTLMGKNQKAAMPEIVVGDQICRN